MHDRQTQEAGGKANLHVTCTQIPISFCRTARYKKISPRAPLFLEDVTLEPSAQATQGNKNYLDLKSNNFNCASKTKKKYGASI
jgi:hypothetical protein